MRTMRRLALAACLSLVAGPAAFAGAPLKGVDVKLCKGAGDDCALGQTDADGVATFAGQAVGDYTVVVSSAQDAVVTITGAGKRIEQTLAADPSGRQRAARVGCHLWAVDSKLTVRVVATDAASAAANKATKSRSNIGNN